MSASGPTIKTFRKRLYTVLPRGVAASGSAPAASSSPLTRVRSNSASRSLYTAPPPSLSALPFFDAPLPPPPPSRPGNPHVLSSRLPIQPKPEPESHPTRIN